METKHFSLEIRENNIFIRVSRVIFGIACFGIACFWLIFNFNALRTDNMQWITLIFLSGFGIYLVWSGIGYGYRFIEIADDSISFRKNSFLKKVTYNKSDLEKISFYPLKVEFTLRSGGKNLLRFGVSDLEKIESIKDELMKFAVNNSIGTELINEM